MLAKRIQSLEEQLFAKMSEIPPAQPLLPPAAPNPIPSSSTTDQISRWCSQISPPPRHGSGPRTEVGIDSELVSLQSSPKGMVQAESVGKSRRLQPLAIGRKVEQPAARESSVDSFANDDDLEAAMGIHVGEDILEDDSFAGSPVKRGRAGGSSRHATILAAEEDDYDMDIAAEMEMQEARQTAVRQTTSAGHDRQSSSSKGKGRATARDSVVETFEDLTEADIFGGGDPTSAGPTHSLFGDHAQRTPPQRQPNQSNLLTSSTSRHAPAILARPQKVVTPVKETEYPWSKEVRKRLKGVFGLRGFRMNQKDIIDATMAGKDGECCPRSMREILGADNSEPKSSC